MRSHHRTPGSRRTRRALVVGSTLALALSACAPAQSEGDGEPVQPDLETRAKSVIEVEGLSFRDLDDDGELTPYEDWRLSAAERTSDLVERMTLEEKAGLMLIDTLNAECRDGDRAAPADHASDYVDEQHMHRFVFRNVVAPEGEAECGEEDTGFRASTSLTASEAADYLNRVQEMSEATRLGIPALFKSNARNHIDPDARAGINESAGAFTAFPKEAGLAAAALGRGSQGQSPDDVDWDMSAIEDFTGVMGDEWSSIGLRGMYGYMADLATEPRWYRAHETFTEDPDLAADIMTGLVGGLQGDVDDDGVSLNEDTSVALTLKHFPGGGPQELGLDAHYAFGKAQTYPADAFGDHMLPFEAAVDAGVASIMPYYGVPLGVERDGEKLDETGFAFSEQAIDGLLREDLEFSGYVNSDTGIINDRAWGLEDETVPERVAASINAGTDTLSGFHDVDEILGLIEDGLVTEDRVDEAATRLLTPMFRMGLFEDPFADQDAAAETVGSEAHHETAAELQRDSLVMLTNEEQDGTATLPMDEGSSVYLLGDVEAATFEDRGFDVVDGNASTGSDRPSAEDSDYAVITLTASSDGSGYVSDDEQSGLDPEHINTSSIDGIQGLDGESPFGAADACVARGAEECTDDDLVFGGAYPWESSTLDFSGMDEADSWDVSPSLETVQEVMSEVDDPSKVILKVYFRQPYVLDEESGLRDAGAILAGFGSDDEALADVLTGEHPPQGRLPFALPATRDAVLEQHSDAPGYEETTDGALFEFGHGLTYESADEG